MSLELTCRGRAVIRNGFKIEGHKFYLIIIVTIHAGNYQRGNRGAISLQKMKNPTENGN